MTTKLKPIFIEPELKKLIEIHKVNNGFNGVNSALVDLLDDSGKFRRLKNSNGENIIYIDSDNPKEIEKVKEEFKKELSVDLNPQESQEIDDILKI